MSTYMTIDSILAEWRPRVPDLGAWTDTTGSRQVRWSELVAEMVPPLRTLADRYGPSPALGTDGWLALAYDDPRRRLGLGVAALQYATAVDLRQHAAAEASRIIAAAADWAEVARLDAGRRSTSYLPRRVA